jgi:outer membrane lipoprotein SlyB
MTTTTTTPAAPAVFSLSRRGAWIGGATTLMAVGAMATVLTLQHPAASPLPAASGLAPPSVLAQATAPVPAPAPTARTAAAAPVCNRCGTVTAVKAVRQKGQASGTGAVIGGVLGGVVGNQMGKGDGRKAMTVLGAVGGGVAGHEIEKRRNASTVYQVTVRLDDGSTRTWTRKESWAVGHRVQVDGQGLRALRTTPAAGTSARQGASPA